MTTLQLFRARVVLEATADVRLYAVHSPTVYALLAAAFGRGHAAPPALPDGLLPDAPEQCRVHVRRGEPYALGFTLLAPDPVAAALTARTLAAGLRSLGESAGEQRPVWGGNFRVAAVEDLVAGQPWDEAAPLAPLPESHLDADAARLIGQSRLTVRFTTPFRAERTNSDRRSTGGGFFDRTHFPPHGFLSRVWNRLAGLGFVAGDPPPTDGVSVTDNRLVWLDFSYGFADRRKRLGGAVGEFTLDGIPADWLRPLALGQYLRVGQSTRFGMGAYRLAALGPDPFACRRSFGLLELAAVRGVPAWDVVASGLGLLVADQPRLRRAGGVREYLADRPADERTVELTAFLADDSAARWMRGQVGAGAHPRPALP